MVQFLAHFLIILAAWTLVIKFALPVAFSIAEAKPITHYILWDFWWVAHLWLSWSLLKRANYVYWLAWAVSVVEIAIIVIKFGMFFQGPNWTIWQTNWFVNKVFVLACFVMMVWFLLREGKSLRPGAASQPDADDA